MATSVPRDSVGSVAADLPVAGTDSISVATDTIATAYMQLEVFDSSIIVIHSLTHLCATDIMFIPHHVCRSSNVHRCPLCEAILLFDSHGQFGQFNGNFQSKLMWLRE